jgi:hypothetical protein
MRTRTIDDNIPLPYVTRQSHDGVPAGSKVIALREQGRPVILFEGRRIEIKGDCYFTGYEDDMPYDAALWLAS